MLRLLVRIAGDGLKNRDLSGDFEYHHNEYRDNDGDNNGGGGLPWYAVLLIVYFSILFLVFWSSLVYFYTRGTSFRPLNPMALKHTATR